MLKKLFGFDSSRMSMRSEIIGGVTTFLTMCYIISVNPAILSESGMDKGAIFTATILASAVATMFIALIAKLPLAQAPSMGINAVFAYTIVMSMGYSWQTGLTIVFVEGLLFLVLTLCGVREGLIRAIPLNIRRAISVGIGMFLAFVAFRNAGIVIGNENTLVELGDITPQVLVAFGTIIFGGILLVKKVKGALFYSIIAGTVLAITTGLESVGDNFSFVSVPPSVAPTFWQFDFSQLLNFEVLILIFILCIMDMLNTLGTLYGAASQAGFVDKDGNIPRTKELFLADAIGTTCGAMLGTSTVTTYLESIAGVGEGARSGLAAAVTAVLFLLALFFAPVFMLIPSYATTGVVFLIGVMMCSEIRDIDFSDFTEAIPSYITIVAMVLTFSIAVGISLGIICYVLLNLFTGNARKVHVGAYVLSVIFAFCYAYSNGIGLF